MIEARRFKTDAATMIVHSFSPEHRWFDAYERFCGVLGCDAVQPSVPVVVTVPDGKRLVLGWACGDERFLEN